MYLGNDFLRKFKIKLKIKERMMSRNLEGGGHVDIYLTPSGEIIGTLFHNVCCYAAQDIDVKLVPPQVF